MKIDKCCLWTFVALLIAAAGVSAQAEVRLPKVFASHMVLQQGKPLTFWGWAQPNETVTVRLNDASAQAVADARGEWKTVLPATKAGGPYTVTVSGSSTVTFEDVVVGEVWICSGQSNMEMGIGMVHDGKAEIAAADYPGIRLLMVPNRWSAEPQSDIEDTWKVCSPKTVAEGGWNGFSATAYFFARELHKQLGVTVGVIDTTWGGTRIESWTPPEGFAEVPELQHDFDTVQMGDPHSPLHAVRLTETLKDTEEWLVGAKKALADQTLVPPMPSYPSELLPPHDLQNPTALFNGMIYPLCPFAVRGAIWYQGEANVGEGMLYTEHMKGLVGGWRKIWNDDALSFYFVQIAPFNYGGNPTPEAELWEAQTVAAQVIPHSGMVVVNDIGNLKDIHPTNKQDVGKRLALWALTKDYGHDKLVCSGPTFKEMTIQGDKLRLAFDNVGGGLLSRDGKPLDWFEIIDADQGGFVPATATIDGATVVLSSPEVKNPVAMHFAWSMLAEPNLMNVEGLPAGAFRAGNVPKRDLLAKNVPEARDYQLLYELDLSKLGRQITYDVNNCQSITRPIDRVAYFLQLDGANGESQFVYASMDAFTTDLAKLGIPTVDSQAHFQQNVAHMNVFSNVKGVVTGTDLAGGNIEFWPNNYANSNDSGVPNASSDRFDFGDQCTDPLDGYGSMQIHNHEAQQTLFAINHWSVGAGADLGIGNAPAGSQPDWTFTGSAKNYLFKRLRVLVHCK